MASTALSQQATEEQLLIAALAGDQVAWKSLVNRLDRYLRGAVRRRAPDLCVDLWSDVIQEVWAQVATHKPHHFKPSVRPARHFVASFLSRALDRVRASYRVPGTRSRPRDARSKLAPTFRAFEVFTTTGLKAAEHCEDPQWKARQYMVEAVIDIERARAVAEPVVALAIDMMQRDDVTLGTAAAALGVNRLTLRRRLRELELPLAA